VLPNDRTRSGGAFRSLMNYVTCSLSRFTFHASRSTLHASRFTLHAPRSTLHASRSTLHASRSTLHAPRSTLHAPRSTLHASRSTLHASRSTYLLVTCHPYNRNPPVVHQKVASSGPISCQFSTRKLEVFHSFARLLRTCMKTGEKKMSAAARAGRPRNPPPNLKLPVAFRRCWGKVPNGS